ncbi:hypothetical protein AVEN_218661-1 [Araneus ventricosus]|uniref:Uncharacterized protein n=1 Tax=Araneus ventricosus TaxID=182803 RepID=A0A4Y2B6I1_ARAVE|nr:hypothetical protein AVEN_218661-1 [Araneus ventricosus]
MRGKRETLPTTQLLVTRRYLIILRNQVQKILNFGGNTYYSIEESRIKIAKLISFLTENENLIKQKPDATSSSDSDPDFSPSPRPRTYRLRNN